MMSDPTEAIRRELVQEMPAVLASVLAEGAPTWTGQEMSRDFEAIDFAAPFIIVRRRSDGVKGSLEFTHYPRVYFNWQAD